MKKTFYITTTAPYVNADPHIGFALEIVQADVLARFKRMQNYDVIFGYGTDEHGLKIFRKAVSLQKDTLQYCDEYAKKYQGLQKQLALSTTHFIRTTDPKHEKAAQYFWQLCEKSGDIYKKNYAVKYCVGCELEKTDSELVDNRCPTHPNLEIESYQEENYFFRFSRYEKRLLDLYEQNKSYVVPENRLKEIVQFVKKGLQDFSISRLKEKMPWGIPVPNDPDHVMYVWFDALIFYISTLGWPTAREQFDSFWPGIQCAGKDNLRQQSAIWQAMLLSAGLPSTKQIFIHGFITSEGKKMSKSLGNVIDPIYLVKKYGIDAVRYYLLREIPSHDDGDFSEERFKELYNADLANGLGNLVARVLALCEKNNIIYSETEDTKNPLAQPLIAQTKFEHHLERYEFSRSLEILWSGFKSIDEQINKDEPWKKTNAQQLKNYIDQIRLYSHLLELFLPTVSAIILQAFSGQIKKINSLFPRLTENVL